ncbi:Gfo/Idh/MocA family oxidoreductase [bacterium]|nr:Gfo/Idh/MocA family oxidoreductase [bacterium]
MINLGVIGCGHWGPNYVRNFSSISGTDVSWVSDLNQRRLAHIKQLYPTVQVTRDYKKIIEDRSIDAVVIATPTATHYRIARECLLHNKHTLIEKPLAIKVREAEELVTVAKKKRKILMVGHTFEYHPAINKIGEFIKKGRLGKVYYLHSTRTNLGPLRSDVSALWDLAPHDISIFSFLLNDQPLKVATQGARYLQKGLEDVAFITLYYPRNIIAGIHVSWLNPRKVREITIVGSKRMLVFDDLSSISPIYLYDKGVIRKPYLPPYYDTFGEFQLIIREGNVTIPKIELKEPLHLECQHFLECLIRKKQPRSNGGVGLKVVKVLEAAQKSLENNGKVEEVQ